MGPLLEGLMIPRRFRCSFPVRLRSAGRFRIVYLPLQLYLRRLVFFDPRRGYGDPLAEGFHRIKGAHSWFPVAAGIRSGGCWGGLGCLSVYEGVVIAVS